MEIMKKLILLIILILSPNIVYSANQSWSFGYTTANVRMSGGPVTVQRGEKFNIYNGDIILPHTYQPYLEGNVQISDVTVTASSNCNGEKKYYYYTTVNQNFNLSSGYSGSPVLCCPPEQHEENGVCVPNDSCQDWTDITVDNVETTYPAGNTCVPREDYGCLAVPNGGVNVIYVNSAGVKMEIGTYRYTGAMCDPNAPEFNPPENPIEPPDDPINTPIETPENPVADSPGEPSTPDIVLSGTASGSTGTAQTTTVINGNGTTTTTTTGTISNSGTGQGMTGSGQGYGDSTYNHQETVDPVTQEKTESDTWNSGTSKYQPPERTIDFSAMNEQLERLSSSGPVQLFNTLKNIVSVLSGTPQAPEFTFNVGHQDFNVSLAIFDTVALIFRSFMAIIIAIGTIYFIFKQWGVTS